MEDYQKAIETDGFAIVERAVGVAECDALTAMLGEADDAGATSRRGGKAFGIRNLMNVVPQTRWLAESTALRRLVVPVLGERARLVRGVFFDKTAEANWKVAWHQDLTIAVRERRDAHGFTSWSEKAGITHVQPPVSVLENMLTLRVHLDSADESNGALRVLPGSHTHGRLSAKETEARRENQPDTLCAVGRGGILAMRPLLLHASSRAQLPKHRRVLHFEYAAGELGFDLKWYEA